MSPSNVREVHYHERTSSATPLLSDYWRRALLELRGITNALGLPNGSVHIGHTQLVSLFEFCAVQTWSVRALQNHDLWTFAHPTTEFSNHGLVYNEALGRNRDRVFDDRMLLVPLFLSSEIRTSHGPILIISDQNDNNWQPTQLIWAESFEHLTAFLHEYRSWLNSHIPKVRFWGGTSSFSDGTDVSERELILSPDLKSELFRFVDNFEELCTWSSELRIPARKGMLLAGHPGSGKTQFIRHLQSRLSKVDFHLFITADKGPQRSTSFQCMLSSIAQTRRPAAIVLEDLDRLADSGAVTPEALLNSIDGLLELPVATLWIATTNDPSALAKNILDRPGRFDRVFIFPDPGAEERADMLRLFSRGFLRESEDLQSLVTAAKGLYGSHIKEACSSALLEHKSRGVVYGNALLNELEIMRHQRASSNRYGSMLRDAKSVGFSAAAT